eukprot:GEMP01003912.1.p1 GENE.GEMP01003912.1~~GEMP01003912.1.p1  ORF type:complete len:884 (+),score=159.99 GEMP01003912.1:257-2908(+)
MQPDDKVKDAANLKVGSLLRMFQSEYFDAHLHMHYLYRMEQPGVHSYLVNELYKLSDNDIDYYLPQLCHLSLLKFDTSDLYRFLLDKAGKSMHFALKIHWLVQAAVEDQVPQFEKSALQMWQESEMAMVNSKIDGSTLAPSASRRKPKIIAKNLVSGLKASHSDPELRKASRLSWSQIEEAESTCQDHISPPPSARDPEHDSTTAKRVSFTNLRGAHKTSEDRALHLGVELTAPNALLDLGAAVQDRLQMHSDTEQVDESLKHFLVKQLLCDYFNLENMFISYLLKLGNWLVTLKRPDRQTKLQKTLRLLNQWLFERRFFVSSAGSPFALTSVHVPLLFGQNTKIQLLRVHTEECKVFSSKKRAPFLFVTESADLDEEPALSMNWEDEDNESEGVCIKSAPVSPSNSGKSKPIRLSGTNAALTGLVSKLSVSEEEKDAVDKGEQEGIVNKTEKTAPSRPTGKSGESVTLRLSSGMGFRASVRDAVMDEVRQRMLEAGIPTTGELPNCLQVLNSEEWYNVILHEPKLSEPVPPKRPLCQECVLKQKTSCDFRTSRSSSKILEYDGWLENEDPKEADENGCLRCLRDQEAVRARHRLWPELFEDKLQRLRTESPYGHLRSWKVQAYIVKAGDDVRQELLASQLIRQFQLIFDGAKLNLWLRPIEVLTTSSDSGLIEFVENSFSIDGLKKKFLDDKGIPLNLAQIFKLAFGDNLFEAKKNFIESFAAYSLVSYFLQVKDRHNGNLLIDSKGHLIHIDFGFMLSNAPGAFTFETSPFKLTQEFLDVMDGEGSDQYEYFRTLMINGFLSLRKHAERIILLVRMMISASKLPCMVGGSDIVLKGLEDRFFLKLTEEVCTEKVADLIDLSVNNWRTIQYDNFQRIFVGIQ